MSTPTRSESGSVIDEDARRRFEAAWQCGAPAPIERFLPSPDSPQYRATLRELVLIELEMGYKARQEGHEPAIQTPFRVESYLHRFPQLNQPDVLQDLIKEEVRFRQRVGEQPDLDEYRARFPNLTLTDGWDLTISSPGRHIAEVPQIPGFEIHGILGRGGMGMVLKANQTKLRRLVALKLILAGNRAGEEELARFQTEAEAVASVSHPNIVQIFEVGQVQGRPYLALEYVEGGTLSQKLAVNPLPAEEAARLTCLLARALHAVHERGILHRDLKPGNVLMTADGRPKISDFGLAKRFQDRDTPTLTQSGAVVGTPCYMAPEQAGGKTREIGPAADIYSLGAILYEMLTGRPPFKGETPMDTVYQVIWEEPVTPRRMRPRLPRDLETICLKCLAKEPSRRYATAQALADDLDRFLAGAPIQARPMGIPERAWRWCAQHPAYAGLSAALLLAAVGAIVGLFAWQQAEHHAQQQALEFKLKKDQDAAGRRQELHSTADAQRQLALSEIHAGRFASAEKILRQALAKVRGEVELGSLESALAGDHEQIERVVDFYQNVFRAERLTFIENDQASLRLCEQGLERLGVFRSDKEWWSHLPTSHLTREQTKKLQRDANHHLLLLAGLYLKEGQEGTTARKKESQFANYRHVLTLVDRIQSFHESRKLPPSLTAKIFEAHCRISMFQFLQVPRLKGLEPSSPSDAYFIGIGLFWLSGFPDDWISTATKMVFKISGLDFGDLNQASLRFLRKASAEDPTHYWSHHWLGWALLKNNDPTAAELAFTNCVSTRPEEGIGYAERSRALLAQAHSKKDPVAFPELKRRGLADAAKAAACSPNDWYVHYVSLYAIADFGSQEEANRATGLVLDLLPPARLLKERMRKEQGAIVKMVISYLHLLRSKGVDTPEVSGLLASAHLSLGEHDLALDEANLALRKDRDQPRARAARGHAVLHKKDAGAALVDFQAALMKEPGEIMATLGRAMAFETSRDWEKAVEAYGALEKAARADWHRVQAKLGLARVFERLGKSDDARRAVEQARLIDPLAAP